MSIEDLDLENFWIWFCSHHSLRPNDEFTSSDWSNHCALAGVDRHKLLHIYAELGLVSDDMVAAFHYTVLKTL